MTKKINYVLLIVCLLVSIAASLQAQHDKYVFRKVEGRAVLSRTGGSTWLALSGVQPVDVRPGDLINVEGNGRGELFYPDGTIVRIKNNAMITVMRSGIQLKLGNAWLKVRKRSDIFKVFTPMGSCAVLGTSFDVDVDRYGKTEVRVFSGIVAVRAAEDKRNRQLVLQAGMRTNLSQKDRVAEKPEKFQSSTIETKLASEWESRSLAAEPQTQKPGKQLPPIRPEIESGLTELPPIEDILGAEPQPPQKEKKEEKTIIIARQRSEFLENLRRQMLEKDSVIGGRMQDKEAMYKDGHNRGLGQHVNGPKLVRDRKDLDREFANVRNRLLRVQSEIRQAQLEMNSLVGKPVPTASDQKTIARLQAQLVSLRDEHRALAQKIRDLENLKR
ncbi:MAG: hypothetical protein Kow0029_26860 [Candidatus Rifleibacteriota bacterium]